MNVLGSVCSEWLSVSDFCRLDIAISDLTHRAWLRSAMKSGSFVWPVLSIDRTISPNYLRWILQKKLKFKHIIIDNIYEGKFELDFDWSMVIEVCVAQGDVLRHLELFLDNDKNLQ